MNRKKTILLCLSLFFMMITVGARAAGRLRYSETDSPGTLNPVLSRDMVSVRALELMFDGLFSYNTELLPVPELAESYEKSPDGLTYTVKIKPNAKWHDGQPVIADDVVFTYNVTMNPKTLTTSRSQFDVFESVKALDRKTVVFKFRKVLRNPLQRLIFKILPKHAFKDDYIGKNDPFLYNPIGSGPFKFSRWTSTGKIIMEKFSEYHKPNFPRLDTIQLSIIPDKNIQKEILIYDGIDMITQVRPKDVPLLAKMASVQLIPYNPLSYSFFAYNMKNPRLAEKKMRLALTLGINREQMLQAHYGNQGDVISGPFPRTSWAYDIDVEPYPYAPEKAKALLAELGYKDTNGDGYLEKDGKELVFSLLAVSERQQEEKRVCLDYQAQLKELGVKIEINFQLLPIWREKVFNQRKFDIVLGTWTFDKSVNILTLFHSKEIGEGKNNFISYSNQDVDDLLNSSLKETDPEKFKETYWILHQLLHDELPYTFLWSLNQYAACNNRIRDIQLHSFYFFTFIDSWFEKIAPK